MTLLASTLPPTAFDTASDAVLLAAWRTAKSQAALQTLIGRHVDWVYAAAVRRCGNDAHVAADITQAVFIIFWQKAHRLRDETNLAAWLVTTTRNVALNARRSAARRATHEAAARQGDATMHTPLDTSADLDRLDDAIAALHAKDRSAVVLRYLRGQDIPAVAAALGTTPRAAQKRIERATEKLRDWFGRHASKSTGDKLIAPTVGVVAAALLATTAHPAAAPAAVVQAVMATPAAASISSAALLAKGTVRMIRWTQLKMAGASIAAATVLGGTGTAVVRHVLADTRIPPPARNAAAIAAGAVPASQATPLTAQLSHGVTIDLAIADNAAPQTWWRPDGSPRTALDWQLTKPQPIGQPNARQIVIQVKTTQGNRPALVSFGLDQKFGADNGLALAPLPAHQLFGELTGLLNAFPAGQTTCSIRVAVGVGMFSPVPADSVTMWNASASGRTPSGSYVIGKPVLRNGQVVVAVSSTFTDNSVERQWVAETADAAGQVQSHIGHTIEGTTVDNLAQTVQQFTGLTDVTAIRSVKLQTRPVEWAMFKNVALTAEANTPVQITTGVEGSAATSQPASHTLKATLRGGTTIELLGVADSPAKEGRWWTPDGAPLADLPYPGSPAGDVTGRKANQLKREFAYRISAGPQPISILGPSLNDTNRRIAVVPSTNPAFTLWSLNTIVPDAPETLKFWFATGPYTVFARLSPDGTPIGTGNLIKVSLGRLEDVKGDDGRMQLEVDATARPIGTGLTLSQLVAFDRAGHRAREWEIRTVAIGIVDQTQTIRFPNLTKASVDHFEYESRPYDQWVEFRNVSLHAGVNLSPTVATSDDAPPARPGDTFFIGGQVMRPGALTLGGGQSITLAQAITSAGLMGDPATLRVTVMRRKDKQEFTPIRLVPLQKVLDGSDADHLGELLVQTNDVITVDVPKPAK